MINVELQFSGGFLIFYFFQWPCVVFSNIALLKYEQEDDDNGGEEEEDNKREGEKVLKVCACTLLCYVI